MKFRTVRDIEDVCIATNSPAEVTGEGFTGQSSNSLNIFTGEGIFLDKKENFFNRGNTLSGGELFLFPHVFFFFSHR